MNKHPLKTVYKIIFPLLIIVAILVSKNLFWGQKLFGSEEKETYDLNLEQAQLAFDSAVKISSSGPWRLVYDANDDIIGILMHSGYYAPQVRGYNGRVPLMIAFDSVYRVKKVSLLPNRETGDFVDILRKKGFMNAWDGKKISEVPNISIDAVSGATETSVAVIKNVNQTLMSASEGFGLEVDIQEWQSSYKKWGRDVVAFILLVLALVCFFYPKQSRKYRVLLLGLNVIIFGFWLTTMLTLDGLLQWLSYGVSLETHLVLLSMLVLSLILPLLTKRNFYCSYVCPMGCMQELCSKVPNRKITIPGRFYYILKTFRKLYLAIIACWLIIGWGIEVQELEPFLAFRINIATMSIIVFAGLILALSLFVKRPWCKYLCPTGLILNFFQFKR